MFVKDWQKWMASHHIKLRGEPNDGRTNEDETGIRISEPKVAASGQGDGRQPGDRHIQEHGRRRQNYTKKKP